MERRLIVLVAVLILGANGVALAQAPAPTGKVAEEALRIIDDAGNKLVRLAEAIPAEKYSWRPGEGVRSVSEVFMHVAGGNFNIPRRIGAEVPAEVKLGPGFDKSVTEKAEVIAMLKKSFEHVKGAVMKVSDEDAGGKTAPWLGGRQATYREIMFFLATHEHEHLGQAIAYTRSVGITPPWTEEAQQRQQQQPPKKNP